MSASDSANEPANVGSLERTISRNVAALMDERRVSQQQLAEAIGLPQSSISKRLRGAAKWTADLIEAVSIAFDVPVTRLIQESGTGVAARPLRPVANVRRRPASGHGSHLHTSDTGRYRTGYALFVSGSRSDDWRIRDERGSHDLPILLLRHARDTRRCHRVAA